jgi:hypothetical protein
VNFSLSAVSVWRFTSLSFVLFLDAIQSISSDQYEAAEIDGANRWHQLRLHHPVQHQADRQPQRHPGDLRLVGGVRDSVDHDRRIGREHDVRDPDHRADSGPAGRRNSFHRSMTADAVDRFQFRLKKVVVGLFLVAALAPSVTTQVSTFQVINAIDFQPPLGPDPAVHGDRHHLDLPLHPIHSQHSDRTGRSGPTRGRQCLHNLPANYFALA